jgi:exodeoxyribonuclease-3
MKFVSWNVNGIRACGPKFLSWFEQEMPEVVALQEIKARPEQLTEELLHPNGYHSYWNPAQKPGYSGTAIYSKTEPLRIETEIGFAEGDSEGRTLIAEYPSVILVNSYFPNSQREHTRLPFKIEFCETMARKCRDLEDSRGKPVILCGDLNVAHQEIDLKNPKENRNNAGFLPEEREWMTRFLKSGYRDVFRDRNPEATGQYTWWSYRPGIRDRNIGWRLDYHLVSPTGIDRVKDLGHRREVKGSDHCPVWLDWK